MLACFKLNMIDKEFEIKIRVFKHTDDNDCSNWCALIGKDLRSGIAGGGNTPSDALNTLFIHLKNLSSIEDFDNFIQEFL